MADQRKIHLVLDFDGTITKEDTMASLFKLGDYSHGKPFQWFIDTYQLDNQTSRDKLHEEHGEPGDTQNTFERERQYLEMQHEIDLRSVRRFEEYSVFGHVRSVELGVRDALAKGDVALSEGWEKLLLDNAGVAKTSIVTVNWCAQWIREILSQKVSQVRSGSKSRTTNGGSPRYRSQTGAIEIIGNEFASLMSQEQHNADGQHDGIIPTHPEVGEMHGGEAKLRALNYLHDRATPVERGEPRELILYAGDSITDMLALVSRNVDIGICISKGGSVTSLMAMFKRLGRDVRHVSGYTATGERRCDQSGRPMELWWARDLGEIAECIVGQHAQEIRKHTRSSPS